MMDYKRIALQCSGYVAQSRLSRRPQIVDGKIYFMRTFIDFLEYGDKDTSDNLVRITNFNNLGVDNLVELFHSRTPGHASACGKMRIA